MHTGGLLSFPVEPLRAAISQRSGLSRRRSMPRFQDIGSYGAEVFLQPSAVHASGKIIPRELPANFPTSSLGGTLSHFHRDLKQGTSASDLFFFFFFCEGGVNYYVCLFTSFLWKVRLSSVSALFSSFPFGNNLRGKFLNGGLILYPRGVFQTNDPNLALGVFLHVNWIRSFGDCICLSANYLKDEVDFIFVRMSK